MTSETEIQRYLSHIKISGFRNLKNVEVDLSPLTVLIGANGAGKSNFIRFFELMTWLQEGRSLDEWVVREGGADDQLFMGGRVTNKIVSSLEVMTYDAKDTFVYDFGFLLNGQDSLYVQDESITLKSGDMRSMSGVQSFGEGHKMSGLPFVADNEKLPEEQRQNAQIVSKFIRKCRAYQFHDTSRHATVKKLHDISDNVHLNSDAGNLAPILLNLSEHEPKRLKLIEKQISRLLPVFSGFILEPQHGKVMLRWRHKQGDKIMGAHLTSDGSLRLFSLITLLNLPSDMLPEVILLDEPELGLHPNAITLIAAMIERVSKRHQVILATQSPFMVNCFALDNLVVADQDDGATRLRKLDSAEYQAWLDDDFTVSELWLSNVLGGQP